jgi:CPA1 family monovalent cation:H+ antiporter
MFVLLGEQLPAILSGAVSAVVQTEHTNPAWLAVYVLGIVLGVGVLRFVWVWASLRLSAFMRHARGQPFARKANARLIAAVSVAGVRGAITLAGVLTLPLMLTDGTPLPARDLTILLAAGVIIFSLVAANLVLPRLLRGLDVPAEPTQEQEADRARVAAAEAAIDAIERTVRETADDEDEAHLSARVAARIVEIYRRRIEGRSQGGESAARIRHADEIERQMRLAGLRAERDKIFQLARAQSLSDATARKLVREIDLLEERLS